MSRLRLILLLFIAVIFSLNGISQNLSKFIHDLESRSEAERKIQVDSFRLSRPQNPVIENDTTIWFLCFSESATAAIAGDPTNWAPGMHMTRIQGTELWYLKAHFPADARFEYKIVKNGKEYILDSLNPSTATGGYGTNSEIRMPRYSPAIETVKMSSVPEGMLTDTTFYSKELKEQRKVTIYLPVGYSGSGMKYPVVLFNDGPDYLTLATIKPVLDRMAAGSGSLAVIGVFIHPVKRDAEYSGNRQEAYTNYVINELVPILDKQYRIIQGPANHVIAGISNGGNSALWIAVNHPSVFGRVAAHSSNIEKNVQKAFQNSKNTSLRVYLDSGTYDMAMLKPMFDSLKTILETKGFTHRANRNNEGHNWGFWRNQTPAALRFLLR